MRFAATVSSKSGKSVLAFVGRCASRSPASPERRCLAPAAERESLALLQERFIARPRTHRRAGSCPPIPSRQELTGSRVVPAPLGRFAARVSARRRSVRGCFAGAACVVGALPRQSALESRPCARRRSPCAYRSPLPAQPIRGVSRPRHSAGHAVDASTSCCLWAGWRNWVRSSHDFRDGRRLVPGSGGSITGLAWFLKRPMRVWGTINGFDVVTYYGWSWG